MAGTLKGNIVFLVSRCSTRIGQGVRGVVWCFMQSAISTSYKYRLWHPLRSWELRSMGVSRRWRFLSATCLQSTLWMLTSLSTNLCRPWFGRRPPFWRATLAVPEFTGKLIKPWRRDYVCFISSMTIFSLNRCGSLQEELMCWTSFSAQRLT